MEHNVWKRREFNLHKGASVSGHVAGRCIKKEISNFQAKEKPIVPSLTT